MSHPADSRKRQPRGGKALGLFVAVWLNLALAPCTMAMEAAGDQPGDHDCPHCPPADTHGHHDGHAGMQPEAPCAEDLSDCGLDEDFSHDARKGQAQPKDNPVDLPAFVADSDAPLGTTRSVRQRAPPPRPAWQWPAGPPIHLLNCVFLD